MPSGPLANHGGRPPYGKVGRELLQRVVYRNLGAKNLGLIKGPGRGLDNAVLAVDSRRVMIVTVDPVSLVPRVGEKMSAWLSVHLIASDLATSGVAPQFAAFSFNLPAEMADESRAKYLRAIGQECKNLGIAVVGGHTGSYPGASFTVLGGGTMFSFAEKDAYLDPSMARGGDAVLMTKSAGLGATASLALTFPDTTASRVGERLGTNAMELVWQCSTVRESLLAAKIGIGHRGVTSMHDATEGGVLGGLDEMAYASGKAFFIDPDKVPVSEETSAISSTYGIDPLTTLSEGSLLLTCAPALAGKLRSTLLKAGVRVSEIGSVRKGSGLWVGQEGRRPARFVPSADRYWDVYSKGVDADWQ